MAFKRNFRTRLIMFLVSGLVMLSMLLIFGTSCYQSAPVPSPTPPASTPGEPAAKPTTEVVIEGFAFTPATITIPAGTTVTWTNKDSAAHTVSSRDDVFDSGNMRGGATFSYTFDRKGTFEYYCKIHPYMTAKVIVE